MNNDYYVKPEMAYRQSRVRKAVVASRAGRSRSSWVRRIAAADKSAH
jgi:hypothetical protein